MEQQEITAWSAFNDCKDTLCMLGLKEAGDKVAEPDTQMVWLAVSSTPKTW